MSYTYDGQSVNLPTAGDYISWSSVTPSGSVVGPTNLITSQSIDSLPAFDSLLAGQEVLPIVDVDNILGATSTFKITLSQLSDYFNSQGPTNAPASAPGVAGLNFHNDLTLDLDRYLMWDNSDALSNPNKIGITMDSDANLLFKDITNAVNYMMITKSGQIGLAASDTSVLPVASGMIAFNGADFYGSI